LKEERVIDGFARTVHHLDHFENARLAAWQERAWRDADQVLCVSDTWTREMRCAYGIEAVTVPNGVDVMRFRSEASADDHVIRSRIGIAGSPVVLAVGGIEARKNTLALLDAFAVMLTRYPRAQLVIAGGASLLDHDAYTQRFIVRAAEHGLSIGPGERIVITGPLEDAATPALFRSADVLAMVSVREGFGLVVLEALACGTPVVASNIAPFNEYLDDAIACWATPTDIHSIATALTRTIDGSFKTDFTDAVPALLARFSWDASARRHIDVYQRFFSKRSPALN
jgi:glycosyltransferase-like protein